MSKKNKRKKDEPESSPGPRTEVDPATQRSSPLPVAMGGDPPYPPARPDDVHEDDVVIPPLRPVALAGYDLGEETASDIAPIGPTEYAGATLLSPAPEREESKTEAAPATPATVEQLEQQIRDLEARLDEMIDRSAS